MPIVPLQSYYFIRFGQRKSQGCPFLAESYSTAIVGIPLARLDRLSVVISYVRATFGVIAIMGFFCSLSPFMAWATGPQLSERQVIVATCAGTSFAVAIIVTLGTYVLPFTITRRERDIRRACGMILGTAADPARVRPDHAKPIDDYLKAAIDVAGVLVLARDLGRTRVRIALGEPALPLEHRTDDLLESIRIQETVSG